MNAQLNKNPFQQPNELHLKFKMVETEVTAIEVVEIMIDEEPILIQKWKSFYRALGLAETDLKSFVKKEDDVEDLFIDIIHHWISNLGEKATVLELILILTKKKFISAAAKLIKEYIGTEDNRLKYQSDLKIIAGPARPGAKVGSLKNNLWYQMERPELRFQYNLEELEPSRKILAFGPKNTGKSQLAKHFAFQLYRGRMGKLRHSCVWLNANNLEHEMENFKKHCGITVDDPMNEQLFTLFRTRKWVIIFDRVDNQNAIESFNDFINKYQRVPLEVKELPRIFVTKRSGQHLCKFNRQVQLFHILSKVSSEKLIKISFS